MKSIRQVTTKMTKYGDNTDIFQFQLWQGNEDGTGFDDYIVDLTDALVTVHIVNDSGYVAQKIVNTVPEQGIIELDMGGEPFSKLPSDHYKFQADVVTKDGKKKIFPTDGGQTIRIYKSLTEQEGSLVPTITFDTVLQAVDEKIADYLATVKKGDQGIQGVQGIQGIQGEQGDLGPVGPQGEKGDQGISSTNSVMWSGAEDDVYNFVIGNEHGNDLIVSDDKIAGLKNTPFNTGFNLSLRGVPLENNAIAYTTLVATELHGLGVKIANTSYDGDQITVIAPWKDISVGENYWTPITGSIPGMNQLKHGAFGYAISGNMVSLNWGFTQPTGTKWSGGDEIVGQLPDWFPLPVMPTPSLHIFNVSGNNKNNFASLRVTRNGELSINWDYEDTTKGSSYLEGGGTYISNRKYGDIIAAPSI